MPEENFIGIQTPGVIYDYYPYRFTDFASSESTVFSDNAVTIIWSNVNNWFYFNTSTGGDYLHHTSRVGTTNITPFENDDVVVGATSNIYFSNDGTAPGTTYSTTNSNTSKTVLTFIASGSGVVYNYELTVNSMRGATVNTLSQDIFGTVKRFVAANFTPAE